MCSREVSTGQQRYNASRNKSNPTELGQDLFYLSSNKMPGKGNQFTSRVRWNTTITATCSKVGECLPIHSRQAYHLSHFLLQ